MRATFITIAVIILVGLGVWWYSSASAPVATVPTISMNTASSTTLTYNLPSLATSTTDAYPAPTVHTTTAYKTVYKTVPQTAAAVESVPAYYSATTYHNSQYGLTLRLPASWTGYRVYETSGGPANLPGTIRIHFVAPGKASDAFVVNVFSKQQWNAIRTEENDAHLNVNDLGEGTYLGENYTWIYSVNVYSHPEVESSIAGAVFY